MLLKRSEITSNSGICANMLSTIQLSYMAEVLYNEFKVDAKSTFKSLISINAKACENRYGSELKHSISLVGKFRWNQQLSSSPINIIQAGGYFASYLLIIDEYLGEKTILTKSEKTVLSLVEKMYRKLERQGVFKSKEFKYINHILYYCDDESYEMQSENSIYQMQP